MKGDTLVLRKVRLTDSQLDELKSRMKRRHRVKVQNMLDLADRVIEYKESANTSVAGVRESMDGVVSA